MIIIINVRWKILLGVYRSMLTSSANTIMSVGAFVCYFYVNQKIEDYTCLQPYDDYVCGFSWDENNKFHAP